MAPSAPQSAVGLEGNLDDTSAASVDRTYPRTAAEIRAGVVPHAYQFPPGNVRRYGAVGDLKTNDTESISQALNIIESSGTVSVHFPPGSYLVDTLTFAHNGTYTFDNATLFGGSSASQNCLVKFTAAYSNLYNMSLNCLWKSSYKCALWWMSESSTSPSQSTNFWGLSTQNTLLGILFGTTNGGLNVPQSENYVYGFHSRGTCSVLYNNQPNGFIAFIGGELASSKNEWDINSPNIYDYAVATVITNVQGVVRCVGCDLEKTDSWVGYGLVQTGANSVTELYECDYEIASQIVKLSAGKFVMRGGGGYWSNGVKSCVALSGPQGGQLEISGFTLNKDAARASANTAFLDLGGTSNWRIVLCNLRLENQRNPICFDGPATLNTWVGDGVLFNNVESLSAGDATSAPLFPRITTDLNNLLDLRGTDTVGNDATTWYHRGVSGPVPITLDSDTPVKVGFSNSLQSVMLDRSEVTSLDTTTLTSVKNTGIKCKPHDQFMVSGWFRAVGAGDAQVSALFVSADQSLRFLVPIADHKKLPMNDWVFINGLVSAPNNSAYMGIGMSGKAITVRMVGLKVSKIS